MRAVFAIVGLIAASVALGAQSSGSAELRTPTGVVRLKGFQSFSIEPGNETSAKASGPAVSLEDTSSGLKLTGKTMTVRYRQLKGGFSEIISATVSGSVDVIMTSVGKADASKTTTQIATEKVEYSVINGIGTLVIPGHLTVDTVTKGKGTKAGPNDQKIPTTFTQVSKLTASSSNITFIPPAKKGEQPTPQKAILEGPVDADTVRTEVAQGATEISHYVGHSDHVVADFSDAEVPTVTCDGNVSLVGDTIGTVTGTQLVVTLDPATYKPIKFLFSGQPTTTRIKVSELGR